MDIIHVTHSSAGAADVLDQIPICKLSDSIDGVSVDWDLFNELTVPSDYETDHESNESDYSDSRDSTLPPPPSPIIQTVAAKIPPSIFNISDPTDSNPISNGNPSTQQTPKP